MNSPKKELREQCYLNPQKESSTQEQIQRRSIRFVHWNHQNSVAKKRTTCCTSRVHGQSI